MTLLYVDDPFDSDIEPSWCYADSDPLCEELMSLSGRTRFRTQSQRALWNKVKVGVKKVSIPRSWINLKKEHATKYRWSFDTLLRSILNESNMKDWLARTATKPATDWEKESTQWNMN